MFQIESQKNLSSIFLIIERRKKGKEKKNSICIYIYIIITLLWREGGEGAANEKSAREPKAREVNLKGGLGLMYDYK